MNRVILYVTASNKTEAEAIAETLVEERLVACVNVYGGVRSFYRWEGAVQCDEEVSFIAKTTENLAQKATERIMQLHSYSCPCVVVLPIVGGNEAFLKWIDDETL